MVMGTSGTVLVGMVVRAALSMAVAVVVGASLTMFVLVFSSFGAVVMCAAFAVHMLVLVLSSMVVCTSLTMNMLVGRFLRVGRRIRQRGNKA